MNVIEIKKLINQIGQLEIKFDDNKGECLMNGENIVNINKNIFEEIRTSCQQKLETQLNQKSDANLLVGFIDEILKLIQNLKINYNIYRIKISDSRYKNLNLKSEKVSTKICQIINNKIEVLEEIQNYLELRLKYFDYKLTTDFGGEETQSIGKPFEDIVVDKNGVPSLNLSNRFKLLKTLKIVDTLEELKIDKKQKTILLALILGINIDNARHLLSNTYPDPPKSKEKELENLLMKHKINL